MDMLNLFSLEGKVALVTGAAYGIGFAMAEAFAGVGAKICFNCRSQHHLDQALKDYAEKHYTDNAFEEGRQRYTFAQPFTKESLLYRDIFERHYPGQASMVAGFWMPNSSWDGCDVDDPSARVLANYGESGK